MAQTLNSIEAAKIEAEGRGECSIRGRSIVLRTNKGVEYRWNCRTEKEAGDHLRLFRASLKYAGASS